MNTSSKATYDDIDWLRLWQNSRAQKSWTSKGAAEWDQKAESFSARTLHSPYVPLLLSRLPLQKSATILDIGCGPGTLSLPLAEHVASVTAIDYSKKMLSILSDHANKRGLTNILPVHCSWEDDWQMLDIEPADIAIASRSMNVADLPMAIDKINTYAKKYVFITDRISPSPFDPEAFAAIGREFKSGPDYIYTLNMLYQKKIHSNVEILELDHRVQFDSIEEAMQSYRWMFKELTSAEERMLRNHLEERAFLSDDGKLTIDRRHPPRWAMIWWKKRP